MNDQLPLLGPRGGLAPRPAASDPVVATALVHVDGGLPHLDRGFDYAVPESLDDRVRPGVRVRVRLAGKRHDGYVLGRGPVSKEPLKPVESVISDVPVLPEDLARLCRAVADHYAGSLSDVLRLAVPPRHAAAEDVWSSPSAQLSADPAGPVGGRSESGARPRRTGAEDGGGAEPVASDHRCGTEVAHPGSASGGGAHRDDLPPPAPNLDTDLRHWGVVAAAGAAYLAAVGDGRPVRGAWSASPEHVAEAQLADLLRWALANHVPTLVVLPDADVVERTVHQLGTLAADVTVLRADLGPRARYSAYLRILSGRSRVVVGTRSAAFAPVRDLRLACLWDDADPNHEERRAPYPHARDVLVLRSHQSGCALLVGGHARTPQVHHWVSSGWMRPICGPRADVRAVRPAVRTVLDLNQDPLAAVQRIPQPAVDTLRTGLRDGPVLIPVARAGYVPVVACSDCRSMATCPRCDADLSQPGGGGGGGGGGGELACPECGSSQRWRCPDCGGQQVRIVAAGAGRTAEELGRMFSRVPVVVSTAEHRVATVADVPTIVVSTAGVEPHAEGGYRAAFLPDATAELHRPGVRAHSDALRRWLRIGSLLRPGAPVLLRAEPGEPPVQAFVRWDPEGFARQEWELRRDLRLPPAFRVVALRGAWADIQDAVGMLAAVPQLQLHGPRPVEDDSDAGAGAGAAGAAGGGFGGTAAFAQQRLFAGDQLPDVPLPPRSVVEVLLSAPDASVVRAVRDVILRRSAVHSGRPVRVRVDAIDLG